MTHPVYTIIGGVHHFTRLRDFFSIKDAEDVLVEEVKGIVTPGAILFEPVYFTILTPLVALKIVGIKIVDGYRQELGQKIVHMIKKTIQAYCLPDELLPHTLIPVQYVHVTSKTERENISIATQTNSSTQIVDLDKEDLMKWLERTFPKLTNTLKFAMQGSDDGVKDRPVEMPTSVDFSRH